MTQLLPVRVTGPLASHMEGYCAALVGVGYTPRTARDHGYVLAHLSRWLDAEGLDPAELTPAVVDRFLTARRGEGYRRGLSARSLRALLGYLREVGVVPAAPAPAVDGPVEELLVVYRRYLLAQRRLAPATVAGHEHAARRFLAQRAPDGQLDLAELASADVTAFVLAEARLRSIGSMKAMLSPLRTLLRFLFVAGMVSGDLSTAVPAVASPRLASLPRGVDGATVAALLASCERRTAVGRRDFAILTLLMRLGMRAGEVAALRLDDIDWRASELVVRGKGPCLDRLPLPQDVGEAVADYLRHGRPSSACRALFVRACAPDGAMSPRSVAMVPRGASVRAGLPVVGAQRLRHTAASEMLRRGASLGEIAEVLRHRSEMTTALYAKVDRASLHQLVRLWPGAGR